MEKPQSAYRSAMPPLDVAGHLRAILLDFAEQGIPVTRVNVIGRATDLGLPEAVVIALGAVVAECDL